MSDALWGCAFTVIPAKKATQKTSAKAESNGAMDRRDLTGLPIRWATKKKEESRRMGTRPDTPASAS
ncbi:hypothetical protein [Methylocystis sp. MJC1]|uniref:hypothetical protein n=1 Tax=Methylocystis sp. MJC1 TaxID=2654282 RepID=UPI0019D14430|nr:hypothetical protein [Methylocystis sp. MJC1]